MRRAIAVCMILTLFAEVSAAAVRGDKAMYVGGTLPIPEKQTGKLDLSGDARLVFSWDKGKWEAPFKGITSIEYGQKAGRRVGAAIAVSPVLLFSKKRKHFVTLGLKDEEGKAQAVVFEISKGTYKQALAALEARSGVKTEYLVEEKKKDKEKEQGNNKKEVK